MLYTDQVHKDPMHRTVTTTKNYPVQMSVVLMGEKPRTKSGCND